MASPPPSPTVVMVTVQWTSGTTRKSKSEILKKRKRVEVGKNLQPYLTVLEWAFDLNSAFVEGLFSDSELLAVRNFREAGLAAQKVFVRLFERRWTWYEPKEIGRAEIDDDLEPHLEDLVKLGLCLKGPVFDGSLASLAALLDGVVAPEIKALCQYMKLKAAASKEKNIEALLHHCRSFKRSFFGNQRPIAEIIAEKVLKTMETRYMINPTAGDVFKRVLILFSAPDFPAECDDAPARKTSLIETRLRQMRRAETDKLSYPAPSVSAVRTARVYRNEDDLVRFCSAFARWEEASRLSGSGDWDAVVRLTPVVRDELEALLRDVEASRFAEALPTYLRRHCLGSVLCATLTTCVEALERRNECRRAADALRFLLAQKIYLGDYRGRWFDRLTFCLLERLKIDDEAIDVLEEALRDPDVRSGRRRVLQVRSMELLRKLDRLKRDERKKAKAARLDGSASAVSRSVVAGRGRGEGESSGGPGGAKLSEWRRRLLPHVDACLWGTPWEVTKLSCRKVRGAFGRKAGYVFEVIDSRGAHVELDSRSLGEVALDHFRAQGYEHGLVGEQRIWGSIFGLLFWDLLYKPLPDAFLTFCQRVPSDLVFDEFYLRRRGDVDARLALIAEDVYGALEKAHEAWDEHRDRETQSLVAWSFFEDDFINFEWLVEALGTNLVAGVCDRLAKDYRFASIGLPNLVAWSNKENKCLVAVVKDSREELTEDQKVWLEYIKVKLRIPIVECNVEVDEPAEKQGNLDAFRSSKSGSKRIGLSQPDDGGGNLAASDSSSSDDEPES